MKELRFVNKIIGSNFDNNLAKIQKVILAFTTSVMLVILAIVVFMRYVLHEDFYGYNEIVLANSFWMYFIGAAFAMRREEHIKADILNNYVSKKCAAVMKVTADFLQTTINFGMVFLSYSLVAANFKNWAITPLWEIPFVVPQVSILISFVLMSFYLTIYMCRDYNDMIILFQGRK